jgi:hypothetical protein
MRYRFMSGALLSTLALGLAPAMAPAQAVTAGPRPARPVLSAVTIVSKHCPGQNASVETAADSTGRHVYDAWMGCGGIGFARSTDGGLRFKPPVTLPASSGAFDPAVAVAPDGTVYVAFMKQTAHHQFPVVVASFDRGRSFPQVARLVPRHRDNFGGRPFIAAGQNGTVYLSWDYGPSATAVSYICTKGGGCSFKTGDLNVVVQKSNDFGLNWGPINVVTPGFPASGADSAPLLVEPDGRVDMEYQAYRVTDPGKLTLGPAHSYFTSSADGGATWRSPVRIGPRRLSMATREWWIDGAIGRDTAGNLYVTWDSQRRGRDAGWLSYSANRGRSWSRPVRVTPDRSNAPHIVEVAGGARGIAYVGWLADNLACGYALRMRTFSIFQGWLSRPVRVSVRCGRRGVWPGGTFGIAALPPGNGTADGDWQVSLSWGSAIYHRHRPPSEILSSVVAFPGA